MNADWHRFHPLNRGASRLERLIWHTEHEKACACRPMPDSLATLIDRATPPEKSELSRKRPVDPAVLAERERNLTEVRRVMALLPEITEKPAYGSPAWYHKKQFFARLHEAGPLVVKVSWDLRDRLRRLDAETFLITPHYRDYPMLLVDWKGLRKGELEALLRHGVDQVSRSEKRGPKKVSATLGRPRSPGKTGNSANRARGKSPGSSKRRGSRRDV